VSIKIIFHCIERWRLFYFPPFFFACCKNNRSVKVNNDGVLQNKLQKVVNEMKERNVIAHRKHWRSHKCYVNIALSAKRDLWSANVARRPVFVNSFLIWILQFENLNSYALNSISKCFMGMSFAIKFRCETKTISAMLHRCELVVRRWVKCQRLHPKVVQHNLWRWLCATRHMTVSKSGWPVISIITLHAYIDNEHGELVQKPSNHRVRLFNFVLFRCYLAVFCVSISR
jgi:hypothetical protein